MIIIFICCELWFILLAVLAKILYTQSGELFNFSKNLFYYLTFYAPAMLLVGAVINSRERLFGEVGQIEARFRQAQSQALQGQLNPHLLFNALNGLAELVQKDANAAEQSIHHMANLMRKVLNASRNQTHRLSEEREILEDFLDMEVLRLGPRLEIRWEWDDSLDVIPLPPLLLQPLVENALKHGIRPCPEGGVLVIAVRREEGGDLLLEVRNTGEPLRANPIPGIGNDNLRERLKLLFGEKAHFDLRTEGVWTIATARTPGNLLTLQHAPHEGRTR